MFDVCRFSLGDFDFLKLDERDFSVWILLEFLLIFLLSGECKDNLL
jgi:hypothetical protein